MDVIRSIVNSQAGQTVSDFARLPGGEVVASSVSGGAQAGTRIALHDIAGSTIALVNPSTGAVETQYTYDPAGVVGMAGTSSTFPFLFQGMEYDVPSGLYHAGNNYYSPQLTRPVSEEGPTPGRTSGNPSSPGDVPGFGGGGGSFAWTYNNLQPQLSASMAAGAGAAGLTAGAAALVSTLGLDIGLTASAAGPVGAVVGALTGLGFLFADLFGGGPDIPRELRLPAHSLLGMETVAGEVDVVDQKPACNCPPAPVLPDGSSVDRNIADAAAHDTLWFAKKVFPHGSWDYKRYEGGWRKWDYAGNFNYGATGRALGLPDCVLVGAGAALQMLNGTWNHGLNSKADAIRAGEQYYDCGCYKK